VVLVVAVDTTQLLRVAMAALASCM